MCNKNIWEAPGKPREGPGAIMVFSDEKYVSYKFHHFETFLNDFSKLWLSQEPILYELLFIYVYKQKKEKNTYGQNKLAAPKKK